MTQNESIRKAQKAVDEDRMLLGDYHPDTLVHTLHLADAYRDAGDVESARRVLEETVTVHSRGPEPGYGLIRAKNELGLLLSTMGDLESAKVVQRGALDEADRSYGPKSSVAIVAASNLSATLYELGDYEDSMSLGGRVVAELTESNGVQSLDTLQAMGRLAKTRRAIGDFAEARALDEVAIDSLDQMGAPMRSRVDARMALLEDLVGLDEWEGADDVNRWIEQDGYPYLHPSDELRGD